MLKPMDNHIIAHLSLKDRYCPKCRGFLTIERELECDEVVCLSCGMRVVLDPSELDLPNGIVRITK